MLSAAVMTEILVHHLERSRSLRVLWLLEELGAPYVLKEYARHPETMRAPPELRAMHPLGRSPVVTIDGVVLAESGAILEHLVDELGVARVDEPGASRLRPGPGTEAHRRYRFFMHYAEGSLMPPLLVRLITNRLKTAKLPFFVKPVAKGIAAKIDASYTAPEIENHLRFLEGELASRPFFVGDELTAADVQMSYPLEAAAARGGLGAQYPNLTGWLERIHGRPAYRRAVERGGPPLPV
jgi:glutathione S-transferase